MSFTSILFLYSQHSPRLFNRLLWLPGKNMHVFSSFFKNIVYDHVLHLTFAFIRITFFHSFQFSSIPFASLSPSISPSISLFLSVSFFHPFSSISSPLFLFLHHSFLSLPPMIFTLFILLFGLSLFLIALLPVFLFPRPSPSTPLFPESSSPSHSIFFFHLFSLSLPVNLLQIFLSSVTRFVSYLSSHSLPAFL